MVEQFWWNRRGGAVTVDQYRWNSYGETVMMEE